MNMSRDRLAPAAGQGTSASNVAATVRSRAEFSSSHGLDAFVQFSACGSRDLTVAATLRGKSGVRWTNFAIGTAIVGAFLFACALRAAELRQPKPVPRLQAIPLPRQEISFQRDGIEIARYCFATNQNRPFVYPIIGPSGRSLTRMGHPRDPESHSHHNSVWLSHHDVNGSDFWGDGGKARIVHQRLEQIEDGDARAFVRTSSVWLGTNQTVLLRERRQTGLQLLLHDEWILIIDVQLEAASTEVTFGKTPFGLIGVRMAKTLGVNDGGGTIRNSSGGVNEQEVFWEPARWVDYSGPITANAVEGLTLFDHPDNPNHPAVFHVRNDGWMGPSLTFAEPRGLVPGKPLKLRYGLFVHAGMPAAKEVEFRWKKFAEEAPVDFPAQK